MEKLKRESKRIILSMIHEASAKVERKRVSMALDNFDAAVIDNPVPKMKVQSFLFLITRMVRFHGGQTSVLRLGSALAGLGYDVAYAVYKPQSYDEMHICASSNLKSFKGKLLTCKELEKKPEYDCVVATSWDTVSHVKVLNGYKAYFVQDYEPYFYQFGEMFLMAGKTYEQGLHMISLGSWNAMMIQKNNHPVSKIDIVDFPYEKSEYTHRERDFSSYRKKRKIVIAMYLKFYGKRLPNVLPQIFGSVSEMFLKDGINVEILYFGEAKSFNPPYGKNLGMLNKFQLRKLYEKADFGVVASMSNISLVPYEMLSSGLPVIEAQDGTFPYFFKEPAAILMNFSAADLYEKIKKAMNTEGYIEKLMENAKNQMEGLSWHKTAVQFAEAICGKK